MESIKKYFPELSEQQLARFSALDALYHDWNAKINVISRKDIDNLYLNHVLHSLTIARFFGELKDNTTIMDIGTGGGFPGIPLAIFYPQCRFHLIDRIGKKIRVASDVASAIGLENVTFQHGDVGECHRKFDYVVSRAVMSLDDLWPLVARNLTSEPVKGNRYTPGLICLKGGDLEEEMRGINAKIYDYPVTEFIPDEHYADKMVIYVTKG